ncbi:MAG TPA: hypothetical protein VFG19_00780 [Geobacteraceae bacterium]|nr:hypothetical protein [Geobacteraceae bacterium]
MRVIIVRSIFIFCAVFLISSVNAFTAERGDVKQKKQLLSLIKPLAELMTSEKPTLKDAARLLGGPVERKKGDNYAYIQGYGYSFCAHLTGPDDDPLMDWCEMFFDQRIIDIRFREIVEIFGEWKKVRISKTSSVRFSYVNPRTGKRFIVFAHLDFPPKDPGSPVKDIKIMPSWEGK